MLTARRAIACLLVLALGGCASPSASESSRRPRAGWERDLEQLEASGKPEAVLAFADVRLRSATSWEQRTRLQLARARALAAAGRPYSARGAALAASQELGRRGGALAAELAITWGDVEASLGELAAARQRYEHGLQQRDLPREDRHRLLARLVLLAEKRGDRGEASRLRRELGLQAERALALAARQMNLPVPRAAAVASAPLPAPAPGSIPADPRALLAGIHPRVDWAARPIGSNRDAMSRITAITVHHSAMDAPFVGGTRQQLQHIQQIHTRDKGWADIGYHVLIDPSGEVWEGRSLVYQGAHAGSSTANVGNIGVCLLGNFDDGPVPGAQLDALVDVLDRLRAHFGVPVAGVRTHREWKATECPGRFLQAAVDAYRARSAATLARQ